MTITVKDIKDSNGMWVSRYRIGKEEFSTKANVLWGSMNTRCKAGGEYQTRGSTYHGCYTSDNFKDFQFFSEWCQSQVGYGVDGYHIDKDLLVHGNKCYSEYACVFVPQQLNSFLTARNNLRGNWPQGVHYATARGNFRAALSIDGKTKALGTFSSPEQAATVYKKAKEAEAYRWYERLKTGEFVVDGRVIERMRTWEFIND